MSRSSAGGLSDDLGADNDLADIRYAWLGSQLTVEVLVDAKAERSSDPPRPDFGEPEAEFRPTFGQTAAGLLIYGSITAASFAYALLAPDADPLGRLAMGSVGVTNIAFTVWVYRMRKWRLWVCPGGVIQRRAWAVDEIAWSEVHEVNVARHSLSRHPDHVTLVRAGPGGDVTIRPINCGAWKQVFAVLLQAAEDRQIAVRRSVAQGN